MTAPSLVVRPAEVELDELHRDLLAVTAGVTQQADRDAVLTRPTLLRRVAAHVARRIPASVDRVVAAPHDAPLATSVALHTGLPFALVDATGPADGRVHGELYPAERVVGLSTIGPVGRELVEVLERIDVELVDAVTVIGSAHAGHTAGAALFAAPVQRFHDEEDTDE